MIVKKSRKPAFFKLKRETANTVKVSPVEFQEKIIAEEKEIRDRILRTSEDMFLQFGYSRVTMDEVAAELGMSKKTLYKFFPSKEHLLRSMIFDVKCEIADHCDYLINNKEIDFVEKLKMLMSMFSRHAFKLKGPLLHDLKKNIPECWTELNEFLRKNAYERFNQLLTEGKNAGAFRQDIDQQLILLIYVNTMQTMINPDILTQVPFSANQVFETLVKIIFEGILSEEGRAKYVSKDNHLNNNNFQNLN